MSHREEEAADVLVLKEVGSTACKEFVKC